jgi:hypothetical protein
MLKIYLLISKSFTLFNIWSDASEASKMGSEASKMWSKSSKMGSEASKMGSEASKMGSEASQPPAGTSFKTGRRPVKKASVV